MNRIINKCICVIGMVYFCISCNNNNNSDKNTDPIKEGEYKYFDSIQNKDIIKWFDNNFIERMEVRSVNNELEQLQSYKNGILDSIYVFYEDGKIIRSINEFGMFQDNPSSLMTFRTFDKNGDIEMSNSVYYELLNDKRKYQHDEISYLDVQLMASNFEEDMSVMISDFNELFYYSNDSANIYEDIDKDFKISIPIPTKDIGNNLLRFIINDYKELNDSTIDSRPILVEYKYIVD